MADGAVGDFNRAEEHHYDFVDINAGLSMAHYLLEDYEEAVSSASAVLDSVSNYSFLHKTDFDSLDVRFLRASSNFALGEGHFNDAASDVNVLAQRLSLLISIHPDLPQTWVVNGTTYNSLEAALAEALKELADVIS